MGHGRGVGHGRATHGQRATLGRGAAWGVRLTAAGLVAVLVGCLTNIVAAWSTGSAQAVVAAVGIPAWMLAHLVYVGASVLGLAWLRGGVVPRVVAVPLALSLVVTVAGVLVGLTLDGTAAKMITWASTEGQIGLAWLLAGTVLRGTDSRGLAGARGHSRAERRDPAARP